MWPIRPPGPIRPFFPVRLLIKDESKLIALEAARSAGGQYRGPRPRQALAEQERVATALRSNREAVQPTGLRATSHMLSPVGSRSVGRKRAISKPWATSSPTSEPGVK